MATEEVEKSKKRGPKGLASTRAKKRRAVSPDPVEDESLVLDPESRTIAVPLQPHEDDEVGELQALYRTAVERIRARDPQGAILIINGTIHEADRILRNKSADLRLSYGFWWVYASALLDLSFLKFEKEEKAGEGIDDYVAAALELCDEGLGGGIGDGLGSLQSTKGKCLCSKAQRLLATGTSTLQDISKLIEESVNLFDQAFKVADYKSLQLERPFDIIQDFADTLMEEMPDSHERLNKWVVDMWTKVLSEDQEDVTALEGCGRVWLSLAQPALARIEGIETDSLDSDASEIDDHRSQARVSLETSVELLTQALKCAEKSDHVSGELLCLIAEATISLANTFEEGPHYSRLEDEALAHLKRAESMEAFDLPERFKDMLEG